MSCTNYPPKSIIAYESPTPSGSTYEITINPNDRLIITVESGNPKINPRTLIAPVGVTSASTEDGLLYYKVDWYIKPDEPGNINF